MAFTAAETPLHAAADTPIEPAKVLAILPHDTSSFTEGLLFHDGALYESTGEAGTSFIRRIDPKTGHILASTEIAPPLFGEGIAAWKKRLFSVTWHGGRGFIWSLPDLRATGKFAYTGEGWGMTSDARHLILSDGTATLRFLDPDTQTVVRRLKVTWRGRPVQRLNELEFVNGEILANIWMRPLIARIAPVSGKVIGWIDLSAIVASLDLHDIDSVANGIAWDRRHHRLYITGKNWPHLYQIALPQGMTEDQSSADRMHDRASPAVSAESPPTSRP
ncbi:glutaminyl-peptide cyclotransferase [Stakelama marina]|uniref:glutaminyl-peptide cyclotransferase n=1 Tax=Stakelama marina TaxID=2826939 RepID=UPI0024C3D42E|nr:glutaminyl-peptide cyclotransferase [Stakelama marina]